MPHGGNARDRRRVRRQEITPAQLQDISVHMRSTADAMLEFQRKMKELQYGAFRPPPKPLFTPQFDPTDFILAVGKMVQVLAGIGAPSTREAVDEAERKKRHAELLAKYPVLNE